MREKGHKPSEDAIFRTTQDYGNYYYRRTTLKSLEKYNDSTLYGISDEVEKQLTKAEIARLVHEATSEQIDLLDCHGPFAADLDLAYEEVSHVVDQISAAISIVTVDNATISFQHYTIGIEQVNRSFRGALGSLKERFSTDATRVQGSAPQRLQPEERNEEAYHLLVNYITASLARLFSRTASGPHWDEQVYASLATYAVKLKVLTANLDVNADRCINSAEDTLEEVSKTSNNRETLVIKLRPRPDDKAKDIDPFDTETSASTAYHGDKTIMMRNLTSIIYYVLEEMLSESNRKHAERCFQIHATIHKASAGSMPTAFYCDRAGEIAVSSHRFHVKIASAAQSLAMERAQDVHRRTQIKVNQPPDPNRSKSSGSTTIACAMVHAGETVPDWSGMIETTSIGDVLSILIPLALSSPRVAEDLHLVLNFAVCGEKEDEPTRQFQPPPRDLRSSLTITTADWRHQESDPTNTRLHHQLSLSQREPMHLGVRAGTGTLAEHTAKRADGERQHHANSQLEQYRQSEEQMQKWLIDEEKITIKCRVYVYCCITLAALIVCGGITAPFLVGEHLKGVDPFQITLFSWILAGFVLLLAKGRYVNDWPWHEFLHGLVVCRSVKEVCDATRFDPQTVLMYLLLKEPKNILVARGPYNGMFARKAGKQEPEDSSDGDPLAAAGGPGFSIDVPVHIATMTGSGFVVLKVLDYSGDHIVCLDARTDLTECYVQRVRDYIYWSNTEDDEGQECVRDSTVDDSTAAVKRLRQGKLRISRILGVYSESCLFG